MNNFLVEGSQKNVSKTALFKHLEPAETIIEAIYLLRQVLRQFGVSDFLYAHMLNDKSFIRNDLIILGTFPKEIRKTFEMHGKAAAHTFGDLWPKLDGPFNFDLNDFLLHNNKKNSTHLALEMGYKDTWIFPIPASHCCGYAGLMIFQDQEKNAPVISPEHLMSFTILFHQFLVERHIIAGHFKLSAKEIETLRLIAYGKIAIDIADKLKISERTVEHRLKMVRKKLLANTTAEAIYKAAAYGIFKNELKIQG